jgi:hypothetical protein
VPRTRPPFPPEYVDFTDKAIGERQPKHAMAHDVDFDDVRTEAGHRSGSIS